MKKAILLVTAVVLGAGAYYFIAVRGESTRPVVQTLQQAVKRAPDPRTSNLLAYVPGDAISVSSCADENNSFAKYSIARWKPVLDLITDTEKFYGFLVLFSGKPRAEIEAKLNPFLGRLKAFAEAVEASRFVTEGYFPVETVYYQRAPKTPADTPPPNQAPVAIPEFGLFARYNKAVPAAVIQSDVQLFQSKGFPMTYEQAGSYSLVTMDTKALVNDLLSLLPEEDRNAFNSLIQMPAFVYGVAGDVMALGSRDGVLKVLDGKQEPQASQLLAGETVTEALALSPDSWRCVSINDFVSMFKPAMEAYAAASASGGSPTSADEIMKKAPVTAQVQLLNYSETGMTSVQAYRLAGLAFSAEAKPWLDALRGVTLGAVLTRLPRDVALGMMVSGQTLAKLQVQAKALAPQAVDFPGADLLDGLISLGAAVQKAHDGTFYPEVVAVAEHKEPAKVVAEVKALAQSLLPPGNGAVTAFSEKKMEDGGDITFMQSPLGVGLYLAVDGSHVLIASSEPALKSLLTAAKNPETSLASLSQDKAVAFASSRFAGLYLSVPETVNLIRLSQPGVSMLSGQQFTVPQEADVFAKALGSISLGIGLDEKFAILAYEQK